MRVLFAILCSIILIAPSSADTHINIIPSSIIDGKEKKLRSKVLSTAYKYKGSKYKYGGTSPSGFDCSGFTHYVFKQYNIDLQRSSSLQSKQGKTKRISELEPADLVFFGNKGRIQHVGIVVKADRNELIVIHSSSSGGIVVENILASSYWKGRLLFGKEVIKL